MRNALKTRGRIIEDVGEQLENIEEHPYIHACTHRPAGEHVCMYAYLTYIHTYIHTYTHTHIHTHITHIT